MPHPKITPQQHNAGFTLVELMITLAVVAILATAAVPSFMSMIASNRVTSASNDLVTALNMGKSEAVRSGRHTLLCKNDSCSTTGSWGDGWVLFSDENNNNTRDAAEPIIRTQAALDPSFAFTYEDGDHIRFRPNGSINKNGRFCFRNSYQNSDSRKVIITQSGRIRTEKATLSSNACPA